MGTATRLGPWLLGTVKDTTGTAAGTVNNLGAVSAMQTRVIGYTETTAQTRAFVLPAGSLIESITTLTTVAYTTTAPTLTIFVNGSAISAAVNAGTVGATGYTSLAIGTANPALVANVGSSDAVIAFTQANGGGGTGSMILLIDYIVRNPNGTYTYVP